MTISSYMSDKTLVLKETWVRAINLGVSDDMSLWDRKRTRLLNGICIFAVFIYSGFVLFYLGQEGLITSRESGVALLFFLLCLYLNHRRHHMAAILLFNLSTMLVFTYYAVAHGEIDGAEYLLITTSVASMVFFRRLLTIVVLFCLNVTAFWMCKYSFLKMEPWVTLPEGGHLYIENHVFTFLGLFFIVYYFRSENLRQERLLHNKNERLREMDRMKSNFFANISHEFRTPLTLILSPLEDLKKVQTSEKATDLIDMVGRNAKKLLHNVNELLDLSKLNAGKFKLQLQQRDIVSHASGIVQSYASLAQQSDLELYYSSSYDELMIAYDQSLLEHILQNLLSNALKFTKPGGKIECLLYPSASSTDFIEICVRDTGIGIAQEHLDQIFERFYQVDDSTTRGYQGTGIGLALVKELVEVQGGAIQAESTVGKGSRFTLSIPLYLEEEGKEVSTDTDAAEPVAYTPMDHASATPMAPVTTHHDQAAVVLLVEDNAEVRAYIAGYLKQYYHVIEAKNGQEGVTKARQHIPDLIVSDVMMPQIDGYELCDTLKQDLSTAHIPVILLTARAGQEDKLNGLSIGADDYLVKPFDSRELYTRIENLISNRARIQKALRGSNYNIPASLDLTSVDQRFLNDLNDTLAASYHDERFNVVQLGERLHLSERQVRRKIKALTGQSPNEMIRNYRLDIAKTLVTQQTGSISEIAFQTGFSSRGYFTKCFKERFGYAPSDMVTT